MKHLLIALVRFYQLALSPIFPPCCRFTPTCSHYALEAIKVHGPWFGSWLAMRRILRCHPFHPGGFDPVVAPDTPIPNRKERELWKPNAL